MLEIVHAGLTLHLSACMKRLHSWRVCRDAGCPIQACERPTAIFEQLRIVRALQKAGICCTGSLPARIGKVRAAVGVPAVSMRCYVPFMRLYKPQPCCPAPTQPLAPALAAGSPRPSGSLLQHSTPC